MKKQHKSPSIQPITAEQIVVDILRSDTAEQLAEDLHELMMAFYLYYDTPDKEFKERIFCTYDTLRSALLKMSRLPLHRNEVCHA